MDVFRVATSKERLYKNRWLTQDGAKVDQQPGDRHNIRINSMLHVLTT